MPLVFSTPEASYQLINPFDFIASITIFSADLQSYSVSATAITLTTGSVPDALTRTLPLSPSIFAASSIDVFTSKSFKAVSLSRTCTFSRI